jgi:hypothetical protein
MFSTLYNDTIEIENKLGKKEGEERNEAEKRRGRTAWLQGKEQTKQRKKKTKDRFVKNSDSSVVSLPLLL